MIFSSYEFIYVFLPITIIGYFILSKINSVKIQHGFLIIMSLIFYGWFNVSYLWIIIFSIMFNFSVSKLMQNQVGKTRKYIFIFGIIVNVLLIGYYKYYDFFIGNLNYLFNWDFTLKHILLPLGISFFTFQQISFLLSCYKNEEEVSSFTEYILFVSFFPQLVAGPIVLYNEMMPQFKDEARRYLNWDNIAKGIYIFAIGLFKKIVIADSLALWANNGFDNVSGIGFIAAWITTLSYTLQIYFDFSGYSDMAIGLGKIFNIDLPLNFNSPYKAKDIQEFWKRWHMTLGRALGQYIYIPLGGNRKGDIRTYTNIIITFLISGIWHGAAWTFVVWGVLHGVGNVICRVLKKFKLNIEGSKAVFVNFIFLNFSWVLFRATNFRQAIHIWKAMFQINNLKFYQVGDLFYDGMMNLPLVLSAGVMVLTIIILMIVVMKFPNTNELGNSFEVSNKKVISTVALIYISTICLSRVSAFIYFNF